MSTNETDVTRREFLGSATLTVAGLAAAGVFYGTRPQPPNHADYDKPEMQVRMGYIGIGNRGGSLMRSSFQAPGCVPVAVADIRASQRDDFMDRVVKEPRAKRPDGLKPPKTYTDYRQLLDDKDVEAVTIATPHYLHGPMAMEALEAGKHVYCEKAMAYTIGENQDLYDMVQSKPNLVFQVGHQRRYSPLYQRIQQIIEYGLIGDVVAIRAQWNQNNIERRPCPDPALEKVINWRLYSEFSGGLSTEFCSHQIDVGNWVLGTHPDSVCGFGGTDWYQDGRDTNDNIHLIFNYKLPIRGKQDAAGGQAMRNVRMTYTSLMQNAHVGPSELILGTKGSIEVCLSGGGEHFIEASATDEVEQLLEEFKAGKKREIKAEGDKGEAPRRKAKAGATVPASCLKRKPGKIVDVPDDRKHWVKFTQPLEGSYDTGETFLAVGAFLDTVRSKRAGKHDEAKSILKADVSVGLNGAVPCLLANMAMRDQRTVHWHEFFNGKA